MTRKGALVLSASASAFVLMMIGGLVARSSEPEPAATPAGWQAREAEYQKLLAEANRRLAEPAPTVTVDAPPTQPAFFEREDHDDDHHRRKHEREHEDDDD